MATADYDDREALRRIGRQVARRLNGNAGVQTLASGPAQIWGVADFLDATECAMLREIIDIVARPSGAYAASDNAATIRSSWTGGLDPADRFVAAFEARTDALLGLDPRTAEISQGQRYSPGQEFKPHHDWFPPNSAAWQRERTYGGQRSITAMVYLNAVEDGGETDFPDLDIAIQPGAGTLIVWNNADADGRPNPLTLHAGNPVRRGRKYIVTRWYRCHRWRGD